MPNKADVKAWKAQLVAQAEQQILKLTYSDQFKKYLNTLAKFHRYSARNIDLIYAQNPQATQVAGFKQWQKAFNRTVNRGPGRKSYSDCGSDHYEANTSRAEAS